MSGWCCPRKSETATAFTSANLSVPPCSGHQHWHQPTRHCHSKRTGFVTFLCPPPSRSGEPTLIRGIGSWLGGFIGGHKSPEALLEIDNFLGQRPALPPDLRQKILQTRDDLERTVRIRAKYATSSATSTQLLR